MAKRGRKPGFKMPEEHRTKIANSSILKCLIEHVCDNREMSPSQVTAALGLLKKVMPDLQSVDQTTTAQIAQHIISDKPMTKDEWEKRYTNGAGMGTAAGTATSTH